jgi:hypothetical protein
MTPVSLMPSANGTNNDYIYSCAYIDRRGVQHWIHFSMTRYLQKQRNETKAIIINHIMSSESLFRSSTLPSQSLQRERVPAMLGMPASLAGTSSEYAEKWIPFWPQVLYADNTKFHHSVLHMEGDRMVESLSIYRNELPTQASSPYRSSIRTTIPSLSDIFLNESLPSTSLNTEPPRNVTPEENKIWEDLVNSFSKSF